MGYRIILYSQVVRLLGKRGTHTGRSGLKMQGRAQNQVHHV